MTKYIVSIQVKKGLDFPYKKTDLKSVIITALQIAKVPGPVEVDCVITDNKTIHRLNKLYRGIDSPTDVLSFGLSDQQPVSDKVAFPVTPGEESYLGEIIISYERAAEQAAEHGNTIKQELNLLMVHGTLHLLGYDHEDNADARKMRAREKKILMCL